MRINTIRLRVMIGWLGMLLPWIVVLLNLAFPPSISATYYVATCITPFMIILGSASLLLISYKGYDWKDDLVLTSSGIAGLGICLFPCTPADSLNSIVGLLSGTFAIPAAASNIIHLISAIVFFALLAYNSIFLFTKSSGEMTKQKKIRNIIYRVCGIGMLASFLILLLPSFYIQTWLMEAIALFFFGISFLTKAEIYPWLFCDKKEEI